MGTVPISRASPIEQIAAAALSMHGLKVSPLAYRRSPGDRDGVGIVLKPRPSRDGSSWAVVAAEEGRDSARAERRARSLADGFRAEYRAAAPVRAAVALVEFTGPSTASVTYLSGAKLPPPGPDASEQANSRQPRERMKP